VIKNLFIQRNIKTKIERALKRSPVVLLTGARQTGKTTLVKSLFKDNSFSYVSFDDINVLAAAKKDPVSFLSGLSFPIILDEIQRMPELFLTIKMIVDKNRQPGMFILTGSANPLLLPKLSDSLAGRMEIINLFPFSQGELLGNNEIFIKSVFSKDIKAIKENFLSTSDLCKMLVLGGFPGVQKFDELDLSEWFNSYLTAILQKDVIDLAQIEGLIKLPDLLGLIASRVGGLLNVAELSRSSKINASTLHRYLSLLITLFIVQLQKPWSKNLSKRFVKSPKVYLIDSGILLNLLKINSERLMQDRNLFGAVFENFVVTEILKQCSWALGHIDIFHYRTQSAQEVDIVLEGQAKQIVGIEVKSSQYIQASDFKGLEDLQKEVGKDFVVGIVIYTGDKKISFGNNMWAIPVAGLWN
jgi:predicted AAA+ superfamily ATPase